MPVRRARGKRLRYRARRRRAGRGMMRRGRRPQVYYYKRTKYLQNAISVGNGANYSQSWGFRLNDMPNATDFTNLYDEYMINKVVVKFIPKFSQVNAITGNLVANTLLTQFMSAIDYDDATALPTATAIDEITQYQSAKITQGNRIHTRVLYPKVELTGTTLQVPKARQYIDCDTPLALHNGLKVVIPQLASLPDETILYWDVQLTYYLKFRNVV